LWAFHTMQPSSCSCLQFPIVIIVLITCTTILRPFFWDHLGEPVPEEHFLDFMVQGKIDIGMW